MSTAATVISNLGTFNWNAKVYDALALDSKLAVAVKNRGNVIRVRIIFANLISLWSSSLDW